MIIYNGTEVIGENVHRFPQYIQKAFAAEIMHTLYAMGETTDVIQAWERHFTAEMKRRQIVITVRVPDEILRRLSNQ